MTLEQKIQAIREKCIAANPEIEEGCDCAICEHEGNHAWRTIRLADVLLAIEALPTEKLEYPNREFNLLHPVDNWNLRADDLTLQTPETINFIYELLK